MENSPNGMLSRPSHDKVTGVEYVVYEKLSCSCSQSVCDSSHSPSVDGRYMCDVWHLTYHCLPKEMVPSPSHVLPGSDTPSTPTMSESWMQTSALYALRQKWHARQSPSPTNVKSSIFMKLQSDVTPEMRFPARIQCTHMANVHRSMSIAQQEVHLNTWHVMAEQFLSQRFTYSLTKVWHIRACHAN